MGIILIGASPPRCAMSDMLSYHRQWIMLTFSVSSDKVFVVAHGGARALPLIPPLVQLAPPCKEVHTSDYGNNSSRQICKPH